ncbi:hypothetical protein LCGC14_1912810 [marine sediment metagenome]|uniref:Uncharacterized protein n=1 Tax=marine sediment metagenome TaxID=412755 RepID=A0A0F9FSX8_9ZZZZ
MAIVQEIRWAQSAILKRLKDILGAVSTPGSTSTTSDSSATVVRNVRDYEILERLDEVVNQLDRLNNQLFLITENQLNIGETFD